MTPHRAAEIGQGLIFAHYDAALHSVTREDQKNPVGA